ncbi:MAG: gliding motility-associated C-terminal domain-containing protein, partial [Crocinitomicaceae bacterium]|nr:gliding motility-associated C-terminal domain-containing protein [Crocinitomicaceae bacterium]
NCTLNPVVAFVSESTDGLLCPETITRIYSVTDDCGNTINVSHAIIIMDPFLPTASNPSGITVSCIGDVPLQDPLVVIDEADNLGSPVVAWVSDISDGLSCPETIIRTYSVTDDCGNVITVTQTIFVHDFTAPTASNLAPVNVECTADIPVVNILDVNDEADNCALNPVVTHVSDASDGLTCPETIIRTYSVTDDCGNTINVTQAIVVHDITPPTASNLVQVNVECTADIPVVNSLDVTDEADNCTLNPVVAHVSDASDGLTCPETIIRTYSVTDDCGNTTNVTQTIVVHDVTVPTASNLVQVNVECTADIPVVNIFDVNDEADNCTVSPVVTWVSDISDGLTCPETIVRTYSVTDGCGNSITVTQTIIVNDITAPTASNPSSISVPGSLDIPAVDVLVVNDALDNCTVNPIVTWVGDVSDGNVCNGEIITRTYSITDNCGNQTLVTQEITILAVYPPIDAGLDQVVCVGEATSVAAINPTNVPVFWDNGLVDGVSFTPALTMSYEVTANDNGCISTDQMLITLEDIPTVSFSADELSGCAPLEVNFTNTSVASSTFTNCVWSIEGSGSISGCGSINYIFSTSGNYDISLVVTTGNGCSNSISYVDYIYVEDVPLASFTPSATLVTGISEVVYFENTSIGATNYDWSFGDGSSSTEFSTTHMYPEEDSTYTIQLIASSPLGCADTAYAVITVEEPLIYYIPNTFTPDGNQYNQTFTPIFTSGYDPYDFTMLIFNRWGEVVWESHDATVGWDGTYGGQVLNDGVYSWKVTFNLSAKDEYRVITGSVNLIR